jgi:hypothetical protein
MRHHIPKAMQRSLESEGKRRGLSRSEVTRLALLRGLIAIGGAPPLVPPEPGKPGDPVDRVNVLLPSVINAKVKELAREDGRSHRGMARQLIVLGLKSLGALPTKPIA